MRNIATAGSLHRSILRPLLRSPLRSFLPVLLIVGIALFAPHRAEAQNDYLVDSLKKGLALARTDKDKIYALSDLENYYINLDKQQFLQYSEQAMQIAEMSRDRKLILKVYLNDGDCYLSHKGNMVDGQQLAQESFQDAEKMAQDNGLEEELGYAYLGLAKMYRLKGESEKSLNFNNLALSIASAGNSDSLRVEAYSSLGRTYQGKNEKLLAFRNYLEALNIAELSGNEPLMKIAYSRDMSVFYADLEEYDKALDYQMKILAIDEKNRDRLSLLDDYNNIGRLFSRKKKMALAQLMYEKAFALADSLRYPSIKLDVYLNIVNMYLENNDAVKGLDYLNKHSEIASVLGKSGLGVFLDEGYGNIYRILGRFDSAYVYYKKAEPVMEVKAGASRRGDFYTNFGYYYKEKGDNTNAISYFEKARNIGEETKDMGILEDCSANLDTLYTRNRDFKTAYFYNTQYNLYKDSLKALSKETDLLKLEVDNDNKRRDRLAKEEEENTLRRHNIQYMGLTVGLGCLFILLIMVGFFVVHPGTIRALGFFSFIFLFEFIILIADKQIQQWTHEEPWKVLLVKICLAAILLPLHHWLEHKVIHYLTVRKKFAAPGKSIWMRALGRKENANPGAV
jgi:tetratricopeptide (TPR) repeat protein